ncbi:hypothetical protein PV326_000254 [Microctonus aethiopoides]|nr:hypothetical protein PV326_000254 [Microctonus aethiopoides]
MSDKRERLVNKCASVDFCLGVFEFKYSGSVHSRTDTYLCGGVDVVVDFGGSGGGANGGIERGNTRGAVIRRYRLRMNRDRAIGPLELRPPPTSSSSSSLSFIFSWWFCHYLVTTFIILCYNR